MSARARNPRKPLLVTQGDSAGIGPEITAKAWAALKSEGRLGFAVIAQPDSISKALSELDLPPPQLIDNISDVSEVFSDALPVIPLKGSPVSPGKPSKRHAPSITQSIDLCVSHALSGKSDALITNPISKDVLYSAGFTHPGHTEYLGHLTKDVNMDETTRGPVMMLSGGGLRVALATIHMPLSDVMHHLTQDSIIRTARVMHTALRKDFGIKNPRIALTGLNPHAGENGALGREEIEIINPAAQILRKEGLDITDAQSADTLFHAEARESYDAVLAMYHDQGLIPVKTLDFHGGVNITLGLPVVRTSPDHGTAFGISGQGTARPDSLISAIRAARMIADNRRAFKYG